MKASASEHRLSKIAKIIISPTDKIGTPDNAEKKERSI